MRRWKLRSFLALVLAIELVALWYRVPPRVSWESARFIETGMTRAGVEYILGRPHAESRTPNLAGAPWVAHWRSDAAWVNVTFDATDRVERVQIENLRYREGFSDLLDRLARPWRRWFP
jgi:hypothetical protein